MSITLNPILTTNAAGTFNVTAAGLMQGTALADPAVRNQLAGGVLAGTETLPIWGGVGISENVPPAAFSGQNALAPLGGSIQRATSLASSTILTGFSVFDQNHSMINTPQSPVPLATAGMNVNFYRLGSLARIAVAIDPVLIDLVGTNISGPVSWDFVNQRLVPYAQAWSTEAVSSATYTSSTGVLQLTFASAPGGASGLPAGTDVTVTGLTPASLNGNWTVLSTASAGTVVNLQATVGLGSLSPTGGTLQGGGGSLPVKVLDVQIGNSMTVVYNPTTGFATWNRSGSAAIILI